MSINGTPERQSDLRAVRARGSKCDYRLSSKGDSGTGAGYFAQLKMKKHPGDHRTRSANFRRQLERHEQRRKARRRAKRLGRTTRHAFARSAAVAYDPIARREQVVLPRVVSLYRNYEQTVEVLQRIRDVALIERRPVMLHFNHVEEIEPAAALALVSEIHRARSLRNPNIVTGTYPTSHEVYAGLREMGFFAVLNVTEQAGRPDPEFRPDKPVFLRFISDNRVYGEVADHFVSIIEGYLFPLNELARQRLVVAIKEAMNNTLDHAHPNPIAGQTMPHRWWLSSWCDLAAKEVAIVFFDQGVGIPETLEPTAYEQIVAALSSLTKLKFSRQPSDGEMIAAATEFHRSSTGSAGRGKGFRDMKKFVDACDDGELTVLSNRGRYNYMGPGQESCSDSPLSLGGTVIEWRFRNDGAVEMVDG